MTKNTKIYGEVFMKNNEISLENESLLHNKESVVIDMLNSESLLELNEIKTEESNKILNYNTVMNIPKSHNYLNSSEIDSSCESKVFKSTTSKITITDKILPFSLCLPPKYIPTEDIIDNHSFIDNSKIKSDLDSEKKVVNFTDETIADESNNENSYLIDCQNGVKCELIYNNESEINHIDSINSEPRIVYIPSSTLSESVNEESNNATSFMNYRKSVFNRLSRFVGIPVSNGSFEYYEISKIPVNTDDIPYILKNCEIYISRLNIHPSQIDPDNKNIKKQLLSSNAVTGLSPSRTLDSKLSLYKEENIKNNSQKSNRNNKWSLSDKILRTKKKTLDNRYEEKKVEMNSNIIIKFPEYHY